MTALVRYRIRLVAELNHRVRGFDAGRQERRQEHERAFGRLAVWHHRSDGQRPSVVILLVLAQATDGSSILSPGAASCSTTLNRTAPRATRWRISSSG